MLREAEQESVAAQEGRPPVLRPGETSATVTDRISSIVLRGPTPRWWWVGFAIAFALFMLLMVAIIYLFARGVGIWGVNIPVAWGLAIVKFVWWIGIGHAGTLISAILLLMRQEWRRSISRFAEAMTLFAIAAAALFPLLHLGRPWLFYWLLPHPNTMGLWPQWRSALVLDFFAIMAYALVSLMFWYAGLLPDLATLRDRARSHRARVVYGVLALGWRGDAGHWKHYETGYFLLAALAAPLVVSVHSIVATDFAMALLPGWHSTIFPPYFVIGALFSGFAMVATLAIPLRVLFGLHDLITMRHLDNIAKIMLASGLGVAYGYVVETFIAWYSGDEVHWFLVVNRAFGPSAPMYWGMILANVGLIQALWFRRVRTNVVLLWVIAVIVNVGMWLERFVIVVTSLQRGDFLPSTWHLFVPTFWDWTTLIGTFGLFFALMFLFIRLLPAISIFEMQELVEEKRGERGTERAAAS